LTPGILGKRPNCRLGADFRQQFLLRDAEESLRTSLIPVSVIRAYEGGVNDTQQFLRWLDDNLFHGATFAELGAGHRPHIVINASGVYNRTPFFFDDTTFAATCSNLNSHPIASAVAAPAAIPQVFAPVVLTSYAGHCQAGLPAWVTAAQSNLPHYVSLLRWLIHELRQWRRTKDDHFRAFVAAVITAQAFDSDNNLWRHLPDDLEENLDLIDFLKALVAHAAANIDVARGSRHNAEAEALAKFKQADANGDWVGIMELWTRLRDVPFLTDTLQTQAVRFLCRYAIDGLVQALANLRQTAVVMQVSGALSIEQSLRVGRLSDNPYVQLAAAYWTVAGLRHPRNRTSQLTSDEQHLLSELLLKVAADGPRWQAWMEIFNKYPVRFPLLQASLGIALSKAPVAAVGPYIDAIWLYAKPAQPDPGRRCVADCLRVFREHASIDRRKALWTAAHTRWSAWNFAEADPNTHIFSINWCDLDYALVGYACECMDDAVRENAIETIRKDLETIDNRWHPSLTDIITNWNRLLSRLQPYAVASTVVKNDEDWLTETKTCLLFDPSKDKYRAMRYQVR